MQYGVLFDIYDERRNKAPNDVLQEKEQIFDTKRSAKYQISNKQNIGYIVSLGGCSACKKNMAFEKQRAIATSDGGFI